MSGRAPVACRTAASGPSCRLEGRSRRRVSSAIAVREAPAPTSPTDMPARSQIPGATSSPDIASGVQRPRPTTPARSRSSKIAAIRPRNVTVSSTSMLFRSSAISASASVAAKPSSSSATGFSSTSADSRSTRSAFSARRALPTRSGENCSTAPPTARSTPCTSGQPTVSGSSPV